MLTKASLQRRDLLFAAKQPLCAVLIGWRSRDRNGGAKGALRAVGGGWLGAHQKGRHPHFLSVGWTFSFTLTHTRQHVLFVHLDPVVCHLLSRRAATALIYLGTAACTPHYKVIILMRTTADAKNRRARLLIDTKLNAPRNRQMEQRTTLTTGPLHRHETQLPPHITKGATNIAGAFTCCRLPITNDSNARSRTQRTRSHKRISRGRRVIPLG